MSLQGVFEALVRRAGRRTGLLLVVTSVVLSVAFWVVFAAVASAARPQPADGGPAPGIINPDEDETDLPWQAGLIQIDSNGEIAIPLSIYCGATVRDATHVITAAHCVPDDAAADVGVVAGVFDRTEPSGRDPQLRRVAAITSHRDYDSATKVNDLALLTLATPLELGPGTVEPLPVVAAGSDDRGGFAVISGWGDTDAQTEGGQPPDRLRYGFVEVLDDAACGGYGARYIAPVMLCAAGAASDGSVIDTCQGDSGGPLARFDGNVVDALIGVVSWGKGCAVPGFPGIYTRLANAELNAFATQPNPPARLEPVTPPVVTGTPRAGDAVTCATGQWTDPAPQTTVTWLSAAVDAAGRLTDVRADGSGPTLTLPDGLTGRVLACQVRAVNAGGARTMVSRTAGPVAVRPPAPPPPPPGPPGPPVVTPAGDLLAPVVEVTRRNCARRRCTLTLVARDSGGDAVRASVAWERVSGCRKGKPGKRCRAIRRAGARRAGAGIFRLRTPRLAAARYRFTVTAWDAAGNRSRAVSVVLRVR
ncbi:serine protease [Conexibacter stalactiti]|uniref:Serine protease n=1 Tax=Conexibacter stalactiti TaxID=1940611 RepID=A0ABU4HQY7_9ACTN|nr:serine protease [Conexibacter stalactiti]MDW5594484.1 serine protease [Conexibacter stalactiti]MEC5035126.1 serine protease [Conexibacter stalactiti]